MPVKLWLAATLVLIAGAGLEAQTPKGANVYVKETSGIRRFAYPVAVRVPFPRGSLSDAAHVRLLSNETEVPAQYLAESQWQDGSVRWLAVDFNANIGPMEEQTYRLQYGEDVKAEMKPRGLTLNEDAETIQVGNMRFSKAGAPLLLSVNYRGEHISRGRNGIAITDTAGMVHDLTSVESLKVEVVKRGPLCVVLRYSGRILVDANYRAPFVITVEMPNSKSWVKVSATVEDPASVCVNFRSTHRLSLARSRGFGTLGLTVGLMAPCEPRRTR